VLMGLPDQWESCSRTIPLKDEPLALACWGDIVAAGLGPNVALLDTITGSTTSVLCGDGGKITSLAFSLDGTLLVSRSNDKTVNIWDKQTGGIIRAFVDDTSVVSAISISPDGTTIASGTRDGAIHLWDVRTGKRHSIETHQSHVKVIKFSPVDSRRLLSLSPPGTIQQWDVDGHQIGTPHYESGRAEDLAYALDGTRFVSCGSGFATVRDSESGAVVVEIRPANNRLCLWQCCFSPDGRFVASAGGLDIYVWDITKSEALLVKRLSGHSGFISFIAFPSSLISGSADKSVKFWQSGNFLTGLVTPTHGTALDVSALILSVNLFAKDGTVVTSDISGVVKTWDLMTGRCEKSFQTPAQGKRDTHLVGDTLIIVWMEGKENHYHVWDVGRRHLLRRVHSSFSGVHDVKIAGDGSKIFGLRDRCIEARSIRTGEEVGKVSLEVYGANTYLIVHGSKVEYGIRNGWGWDFGGPKVSDYEELPDRPRLDLVDWSDGRRIQPRWVEDTVTKRLVFRLPDRCTRDCVRIVWDGQYLIVWTPTGDLVVMDLGSVFPR
jgi:hypothetical protein